MLQYFKKHISAAVFIAGFHFLFLLLIQLENYWLHVFDASETVGHVLNFWIDLIRSQHELLAVSIGLGALYFLFAVSKCTRVLFLIITLLIYIHLVIDQVNYKIFFGHALPSMMDEGTSGLSALLDSIISEMDLVTLINGLLALSMLTYLYKLLIVNKGVTNISKAKLWLISICVSAYSSLLFLPSSGSELRQLNQHLYVDIAKDLIDLRQHDQALTEEVSTSIGIKAEQVYELRYGKDLWPLEPELQKLSAKIKASPQKNLIFIVLESVGTEQLLPNGEFSIKHTPNLHKYADNMLIFDSIYVGYPATARSHLRMNTGGYALTWGEFKNDVKHPYTGPTLAKEFRRHGFNRALFSAGHLDFGNITAILKQDEYDHYFHFGIASDEFKKQSKLNSWGGEEGAFKDKAVAWLKQQERSKPFFLHFMTSSTHHPYSVPDGYQGPYSTKDRKSLYYNSLHYTDAVIGQLIDELKALDLFEDTTIVLTGDHGQAFGERHKGNMTHKNYLYEENIKNFFIVLDSKNIDKQVLSSRHGKEADILPTLTGLYSSESIDVLGQDLLSPHYRQKMIYFHKLASPAQWGLIDGRWKFISKLSKDEPDFELYDLIEDPLEKNNLAEQYSQRNSEYQDLLWAWFNLSNEQMLARIEGHKQYAKPVTDYNFATPGPKHTAFGYKDETDTFQELDVLHPEQRIFAFTQFLSYAEKTTVHYEWISPSKERFEQDFTVKANWDKTWVSLKAPRPVEEGAWLLNLYQDGKKLLSSEFKVSKQASLFTKIHPKVKKNIFGYKQDGKFSGSDSLTVDKRLVSKTSWRNVDTDKTIKYVWTAPDKQTYKQNFKVKQGWKATWVSLKAPLPIQAGQWTLALWHDDKKLLEEAFTVKEAQKQTPVLQ